jgi:hypothetical protein
MIAISAWYLGAQITLHVDEAQLVYNGVEFVPAYEAEYVVLSSGITSTIQPEQYAITNISSAIEGTLTDLMVCGVVSSVPIVGGTSQVVQTAPVISGLACSLLATRIQGVYLVVAP